MSDQQQQQKPKSPRQLSPRNHSQNVQQPSFASNLAPPQLQMQFQQMPQQQMQQVAYGALPFGSSSSSSSKTIPADEAVDHDAIKRAQQQTTKKSAGPTSSIEASFALEVSEVAASSSKNVFGVLKLVAPTVTAEKASERQPIDIVCVVDKSGSMSGTKIQLLCETLRFITNALDAADRFSIIQFDGSASVVTGLKRMTSSGKETTLEQIKSIGASGGTDIADGLSLGLKVLRERRERNSIASVLLLTDGQDSGSLHKLDAVMRDLPNCSIHTFGFGSDHDAKVLTAISSRVQGTFTYIESLPAVGPAFASTLGGLVSIVAVDIEVSFKCHEAASLAALYTKFKHTLGADKASATVQLPDLFGAESRDIVFELHIPARDGEHVDEIQSLCTGSVTYSQPGADSKTTVDASALNLLRPKTASASPTINVDVNAQRNRVLATEALEKAATLAEASNLAAARETLDGAITAIKSSASASHALCIELLKDLTDSRGRLVDQRSFQTGGYAQMQHQAQQHMQQRQTNSKSSNAYGYNACQTSFMSNYDSMPKSKK